jgi:hypothetical protein
MYGGMEEMCFPFQAQTSKLSDLVFRISECMLRILCDFWEEEISIEDWSVWRQKCLLYTSQTYTCIRGIVFF